MAEKAEYLIFSDGERQIVDSVEFTKFLSQALQLDRVLYILLTTKAIVPLVKAQSMASH